ncbi:MAG: helix-turn-helix domain-containing protein [Ruminococcus sp.]|nr:helix-turn-helix domain-containing protein [Ruminococcus sp.]
MNKTDKDDSKIIVKRIIALLGTRDQSELTEFLNLKKGALTEWKNGKSTSFKKYIVKIAEFFNVSLDFLILGKQTFSLSNDEEMILKMYRLIEEKDQPIAKRTLENMALKNVDNARQSGKENVFEVKKQTDYESVLDIAKRFDWVDPHEKVTVRKMLEKKLAFQADKVYENYRRQGREISREAVDIVKMYSQLDENDKAEISEVLKDMTVRQVEEYLHGQREETNITFAVARSDDNEAPRIITNELDDVLNAPDVTDEY